METADPPGRRDDTAPPAAEFGREFDGIATPEVAAEVDAVALDAGPCPVDC